MWGGGLPSLTTYFTFSLDSGGSWRTHRFSRKVNGPESRHSLHFTSDGDQAAGSFSLTWFLFYNVHPGDSHLRSPSAYKAAGQRA